MRLAHMLNALAVFLAISLATACTRYMGRLSDVRVQRVAWADVDKRGMMLGCCDERESLRVDFLSDMDYSQLRKYHVYLAVRYGWCPFDADRSLGSSKLLSDSGEVEGETVMVPVAGRIRHRLFAYHGFLPLSSPGRRYVRPGEDAGAYDLRHADRDMCVNVGGGVMWFGRHGQSKGGVVPRAVLIEAARGNEQGSITE